MKLNEALAAAKLLPTLAEALTLLALWECDRAVKQAVAHTKAETREPNGQLYETCFTHVFERLLSTRGMPEQANGEEGWTDGVRWVKPEQVVLGMMANHEDLKESRPICFSMEAASERLEVRYDITLDQAEDILQTLMEWLPTTDPGGGSIRERGHHARRPGGRS